MATGIHPEWPFYGQGCWKLPIFVELGIGSHYGSIPDNPSSVIFTLWDCWWVCKHIVILLDRCMTPETFINKRGILTIRFLLQPFPASKPPSSGVLVFFWILNHEFDMNELTRDNCFFPTGEGTFFPYQLAQNGAIRPRVGLARSCCLDCCVIAENDTKCVVV